MGGTTDGSPSTVHVDSEVVLQAFIGFDAGVYLMDNSGRIVAVNPKAAELLARPAEEFIGEDAHDLLHRESDGSPMPRAQCRLLQAYLGGRPVQIETEWFLKGTGEMLPVALLSSVYKVGGEPAGAAVLFFEYLPRDTTTAEQPQSISTLTALAERLALVAETTTVLTSTLDLDEALGRLVQLVIPRMGDWAIVDLLVGEHDLRRVAVAHYEGGAPTYVDELTGPLPPPKESSRSPLTKVLQGGLTTQVGPEAYRSPADSGLMIAQQKLFEATRMHTAVIAPLRGSRSVVGALTIGRADQLTEFDISDIALVDDIAHRAGLAVENAQLFERQRRVAETMQRHLLPQLPKVDGLDMVARYLAAPRASQVGGDWYDAFLQPDRTTCLVIGDVVGHDLQAAAYMSQVRNMLRAFAWDTADPPSVVIDRLDQALGHISDATMATLVLARVEGPEGGPWQLRWSNAGHPPPLLVGLDGKARYLSAASGVLLGAGVPSRRSDAVVPLPPRSTLLLYTDGLVESPQLPVTDGLELLRRYASSLVRSPLDEMCDQLLERALPRNIDDDVALLAVRVPPGRNRVD